MNLLAKIPTKWRYGLYITASVLSLGYTAYQAGGGDWKQAVPAFIAMLLSATAATNTGSTGLFNVEE